MAWGKVSTGNKLADTLYREEFINDLVEVVNTYKEGRLFGGRRGVSRGSSGVTVQVRNMTEADQPRGAVLQLGDHLLDAVSDDHPWFEADKIAEPVEYYLAVLTKPLLDGEIGPAQISGICLAKVNVGSTSHTHAKPTAGDEELTSSTAGPFEFLLPPTETGVQDLWVVMIDRLFPRVCKLKSDDAPLAEGSVGTFIIYRGTPGSETSTSFEFEACARWGEVPDDAVFCLAEPTIDGWYAAVRACTEEEMGG